MRTIDCDYLVLCIHNLRYVNILTIPEQPIRNRNTWFTRSVWMCAARHASRVNTWRQELGTQLHTENKEQNEAPVLAGLTFADTLKTLSFWIEEGRRRRNTAGEGEERNQCRKANGGKEMDRWENKKTWMYKPPPLLPSDILHFVR